MSAPAFTPGPWEAVSDIGVVNAGERQIAAVLINGNVRQREANARLIAAAPELYELAEQFERVAEYELRKMQRENADDDEGIRLRQLNLNLIRAALAKVRAAQ